MVPRLAVLQMVEDVELQITPSRSGGLWVMGAHLPLVRNDHSHLSSRADALSHSSCLREELYDVWGTCGSGLALNCELRELRKHVGPAKAQT